MKLRSKDNTNDERKVFHKLQSHEILPRNKLIERTKNSETHVVEELEVSSLPVTDFEKKFGISEDNILPEDDKVRYQTRRKQVDYRLPSLRPTLKKQKVVTVEETIEQDVQEVAVVEEKPVEEVATRETIVVEEDENSREKELNMIVKSLIANLKNIPLLNELDPKYLRVSEELLGEGQYGVVRLGTYQGITVACKSKRRFATRERSFLQFHRELDFASKLTLCRYINRYIGWTYCNKHKVQIENKRSGSSSRPHYELYVIQPYIQNLDARNYLSKREKKFQPNEVLQASICLFSALADAHTLNIGIVDLKLENFLIDSCGSGWLTDFGSCIELESDIVDLDAEEVHWTRSVAAPEMLRYKQFLKASDVFMGTLIIAELMTAELNDEEFSKKVLQRKHNGDVEFSHDLIDKGFRRFFKILKAGLCNFPSERPDANTILQLLIEMK